MAIGEKQGLSALTEKEKQTLRLIVRGHDAKSTARSLGLSIHTINERLRDARRKVAVSSSREAARLLFEAEGGGFASGAPNSAVDQEIGGAATPLWVDERGAPINGVRWLYRPLWTSIGVAVMTFALALVAFIVLPGVISSSPAAPASSVEAPDAAVVDSARQWLALVDQGRWDESYRATGASFRELNTAQVWAATSEKVRAPLGAMISRTFVSQENLPAPPSGYEVVKFRTRFANKAEALETVTLNREGGGWHVVGVTIG
jgi:DNA-binding CsgD family transcriptional regulator